MKKAIFFISFSILSIAVFSQGDPKTKAQELYFSIPIKLSSNTSPGLDFKSQIGDKTYLRYTLYDVNGRISANDNNDYNYYNIGATVGIGLERRNEINQNFSMFYGIGIGTGYEYYLTQGVRDDQNYTNTRSIYSGLVPLNIGMMFNISDKFSISSEFIPSFRIDYEESKHSLYPETNSTKTTYSFNISDFFGRVSLVYKL